MRICGQKAAAGGERIGSFYCHVAPYTSNFLEACGWELGEDIFDRYIDRGSVKSHDVKQSNKVPTPTTSHIILINRLPHLLFEF